MYTHACTRTHAHAHAHTPRLQQYEPDVAVQEQLKHDRLFRYLYNASLACPNGFQDWCCGAWVWRGVCRVSVAWLCGQGEATSW
jgi:hypothetical protein